MTIAVEAFEGHLENAMDGELKEKQAGSAPQGTLAEIAGLDVEGAVRRFMGNRVLYESLMRKFVNGDMALASTTVKTQLTAGDVESARRTAHTLKGVAGTIGASELQLRAERLERIIRDSGSSDECERARQLLEEELSRLLTAVRSVLGEVAPGERT